MPILPPVYMPALYSLHVRYAGGYTLLDGEYVSYVQYVPNDSMVASIGGCWVPLHRMLKKPVGNVSEPTDSLRQLELALLEKPMKRHSVCAVSDEKPAAPTRSHSASGDSCIATKPLLDE